MVFSLLFLVGNRDEVEEERGEEGHRGPHVISLFLLKRANMWTPHVILSPLIKSRFIYFSL